MKTLKVRFAGICAVTTALALTLALTPQLDLWAADDDIPEFTHDGLKRVIDSKAALAYIKPDVDFSRYDRFMILDCYVAFKENWQRDHNRQHGSLGGRVSDRDMERIRNDMAEVFREVFVEELTENDGYELVDEPAAGTLLIRPAIIDLVATAPDTRKRREVVHIRRLGRCSNTVYRTLRFGQRRDPRTGHRSQGRSQSRQTAMG